MSWHFSRVLVEEFCQATCLDGQLFAPLRSMTTREAYCWRDKTTESLDLFQFGMTLEPSTRSLGEELLTWYLEGFRAKTSASPDLSGENATESLETAADYGTNTSELSMRSCLNLFLEKTPRSLKLTGCQKSFEDWPRAGMFADGSLSELTIADFRTSENGFGFLLPTPTSRDWKDTPGMTLERKDGKSRTDRLPMLLFSCVRSAGIDWKTTTATDAQTVSVRGLEVMIMGSEYSPDLPEWLMGWPLGWTDCAPLEMDKFLQWQREHSVCF